MRKITIDMSDDKTVCRKCGRIEMTQRHHKGNDGLLGRMSKTIARQYDKFLDCVRICDECHMTIHFVYETTLKTWEDWSDKGILKLRLECIKVCDQWLTSKEKVNVPLRFRRSWETTSKAYRMRQENLSLHSMPRTSGKRGTGSKPT